MLVIYGPGGFGRELIAPAQQAASRAALGEVLFASDNPQEVGQVIGGIQVVDFSALSSTNVVIAVADATVRRRLAEKVVGGGHSEFELIAPTHQRGVDIEVGPGGIFCDFTMVTASARIGRHFHCNIFSYVAHDCVIGNFVTFAPKVCCNGNVHIDDDAYIGTGAILRQGKPGQPLRIGKGAVVGMGAVVTKDVAPGETVVGNPARPLERRS